MKDRVIVVTGGQGVLGRAVVRTALAGGARVAAVDYAPATALGEALQPGQHPVGHRPGDGLVQRNHLGVQLDAVVEIDLLAERLQQVEEVVRVGVDDRTFSPRGQKQELPACLGAEPSPA